MGGGESQAKRRCDCLCPFCPLHDL